MHAYLVRFYCFNVRDGTESKYPSIVFLSIYSKQLFDELCGLHRLNAILLQKLFR